MAHGAQHGSVETTTGYQTVGPNKIIDGPSGPGSYPTTPDRSLVRMADPRIENQMIPTRTYPGPGSENGKPVLNASEEGSGRC